MKALNTYTMMKRVALFVSLMVSVAALTACGNKGGTQSRTNDNYYGNPNCVGCGGGNILGSGVGNSYWFGGQQVEASLQMNLYLVAGNGGQAGVSGDGRFDMMMPYAYSCGVPQGSYTVTSVNPGTYGGVTFGNMQLVATGPTQVMLIVPSGGLSLIGNRITGVAYMNYQTETCKLLLQ